MANTVLNSSQLMDQILMALDEKRPLSVVSVGATETFVMAQYTVLSEEEFMNHPEARVANRGEKTGFYHRGVRFPNIKLRDDTVEAVRTADIVGYNTRVRLEDAGPLTEKVFQAYGIDPLFLFDSYIRRVFMFSQRGKFEEMLKGRRILLVGSPAESAKTALETSLQDRLGFEIVGTVRVDEYEEVPEARKQIDSHAFDLCLLAAGTNAVILASYIAKTHGKVAFDIGSGMQSFITGEVYSDFWLEHLIGLDNLMQM
jgi:hypothetical protein